MIGERTSLEEVAFHKTRELSYIDYYHDEARYRALNASFIGRHHDIGNIVPVPACLDADVGAGYAEGQGLANRPIFAGSRGLVYSSVRHEGGPCIVAFQPNAVQDVAPGRCWLVRWTGTNVWTVTAV